MKYYQVEMTSALKGEVFLKPLEWLKGLHKLFQRCVKERNLLILIAAGRREHSLVVLPFSTPFSLSSSPPISSHPTSLQCPRSLNQRLHQRQDHSVQITPLCITSTPCLAEHRVVKWCVHMHALNGRERGWGERGMGEGLDWGKELMSRNKRRRQCCRIKMFRKLTDVDALHKRIWLRTSVSSLPSPLLLFLFPFTLSLSPSAFSLPALLYSAYSHLLLSLSTPLVSEPCLSASSCHSFLML